MAASLNPKRKYDVFLSFRGPDVRKSFLSHLYAALIQKGIHTFKDSEELWKGEEISPALMGAIEESRVAIVVFSKNYPFSRWCLKELVQIMECKVQKGLIVFPVFYEVQPREVRRVTGSYGTAMTEHESRFREDPEKVKKWKKALFDAGSLTGWESNDRDEAELIQEIIEALSIHLNRKSLYVAKYVVGIGSQVQELELLSKKESDDDDVLLIGLWGPGGIGKTTIAKALYNNIKKDFEGSSFLAQVREHSNRTDDLVALQKQLLSKILFDKNLNCDLVDEGKSLIQERLCCKKVLLVLDDVDQMGQLDALVGKGWFGKGSRIIVTSRNKRLLNSHDINCYVHEVQPLGNHDARDLFGWHAFPNGKRVEIRRDLIDKALCYANGLPLALEVLGSFLRGRNEREWEGTLLELSEELLEISNGRGETINHILKISIDGLDSNTREIFLDIACFFKGDEIDYIKRVLDSCGLKTTIGIPILIERSLIKNENGFLQMHDLVQLMGKDIINQECRNDPGKRSRIWLFEDVLDILFDNTETRAVKAIVLELPAPEKITISSDTFANVKMLRILILRGLHVSSQDPIRLPNGLRYLEWANAPELEFGSGPKKLVSLHIENSHIRQLGSNFQIFRNLKSITLEKCESLAIIPDLSSAPTLEYLLLKECNSLMEVHPSVGDLDKLEYLVVLFCSNLSIFPSTLKTKSLRELRLLGCPKLEKFPDILEKMERHRYFDIGPTAIKELPASIENFVSIYVLRLRSCKNPIRLTSSIYKLKSLQELDLSFRFKLEKFPDIREKMEFLRRLSLFGMAIKELPASIANLVSLVFLDLRDCKNLVRLPSSIYKLKNLGSLLLDGCSNFVMFPKNLEDSTDPNGNLGFQDLSCLSLYGCNLSEVEFLDSPPSFPALEDLNLEGNRFIHLPTCINKYDNWRDSFTRQVEKTVGLPPLERAYHFDSPQKQEFGFWGGVNILLSGREMPGWIHPLKESSIFFMVPQDLHDKFQGIALCFVTGRYERKNYGRESDVKIFVNGQLVLWDTIHSTWTSDLVRLVYTPWRRRIEKVVQNGWNHFQVCISSPEVGLKKCGLRLICKQQEDDLKIAVQHHQHNQPIETNWVSKESNPEEDNSIDIEGEDGPAKPNATKRMRLS